jgi:broad specificity phosphatase PhoE
MSKRTILLMRHAEKSDDPFDPDLTKAGHERARELATYIPATFGTPDFLFAASNSKHSHRPQETLTPLAKRLGLALDMDFADQDYGALAHTLRHEPRYAGKLLVVCWHHGNIPSFSHALEVPDGDYPDPWKASVFNLILQFGFDDGGIEARAVTEPF